jgi:hypothetical protein
MAKFDWSSASLDISHSLEAIEVRMQTQAFAETEAKFVQFLTDDAAFEKAWGWIDSSGNGISSLAEVDRWITFVHPVLNQKRPLNYAFYWTTQREGDGDAYVEKFEGKNLLLNILYFHRVWLVYANFDKDGDHKIDAQEFHKGLQLMGLKMSKAEAEAAFLSIDLNHGGSIMFDEFAEWCATLDMDSYRVHLLGRDAVDKLTANAAALAGTRTLNLHKEEVRRKRGASKKYLHKSAEGVFAHARNYSFSTAGRFPGERPVSPRKNALVSSPIKQERRLSPIMQRVKATSPKVHSVSSLSSLSSSSSSSASSGPGGAEADSLQGLLKPQFFWLHSASVPLVKVVVWLEWDGGQGSYVLCYNTYNQADPNVLAKSPDRSMALSALTDILLGKQDDLTRGLTDVDASALFTLVDKEGFALHLEADSPEECTQFVHR